MATGLPDELTVERNRDLTGEGGILGTAAFCWAASRCSRCSRC